MFQSVLQGSRVFRDVPECCRAEALKGGVPACLGRSKAFQNISYNSTCFLFLEDAFSYTGLPVVHLGD